MGGEKLHPGADCLKNIGSPPRGRGKVLRFAQIGTVEGITPAWAGKSPIISHFRGVFKDHPRVGGEKLRGMLYRGSVRGSPPRGRGKGFHLFQRIRHHGITPAWAGKSFSVYFVCPCHGDHPRVGGEKPEKQRRFEP